MARSSAEIKVSLLLSLSVLTVLGIGTATVAAKELSLSIVVGSILLLVLVSIGLARATKKISAIVFISTIGAYISRPWFFAAGALKAAVKTVDFLSIATVMVTLAGQSLGKDIPLLKNIGWKIIPATAGSSRRRPLSSCRMGVSIPLPVAFAQQCRMGGENFWRGYADCCSMAVTMASPTQVCK
ncbi:hypothetical protein [Arthrobacter oryzae]|uniref:Uncharacterized protein n=1 Tax=Arthrobacter oryzae TaxID=409290 RepID=A0A495E807_9MICC|nr:hypothetical protein [Arthrobacter oryzae]RKR12709.1 hypothetical protein C8D78_3613 [Arthrobacter oryzae]